MRFRHLLILFFMCVCASACAQVGFGPVISGGMSSMKFLPPQDVIQYPNASVKAIASGKIGGIVDLPMNKHFYLQPGLVLSALMKQ